MSITAVTTSARQGSPSLIWGAGLSDDTQVLAYEGWRDITSISVGDQVVTFIPSEAVYTYGAVQAVHRRDRDDESVRLRSDGIDCLAAQGHRAVIRRAQRAMGRRKMYGWTFCQADQVPCHAYVPIGGAPVGSGVVGLTSAMCRLIGWVITDGHYTGGLAKRYLGIEQSTMTRKMGRSMVAALAELLSQVGSFSTYTRPARTHNHRIDGRVIKNNESKCFYLRAALSSEVLQWMEGQIHRIPRSIMTAGSRAQLEALYAGLLEGDGTAIRGSWRTFYAGKNESLADDFQELALRLGQSATKSFVPQNGQWIVLLSRRPHHYLRRSESIRHRGHFAGLIVPSGAFVARRRGKAFVTGSSKS